MSGELSLFERRHFMKVLTIGLVGLVSAGLAVGNAFAFSCPSLGKAANDAIAKAEPMAMKATDDKQKARDMGIIESAKDLSKQADACHSGGKHGPAEAQA